MSTHAFIQTSPKFFGHFQVVVHRFTTVVDGLYQRCDKEVIDCHNLGTAVTIRDRLNNPEPVAVTSTVPNSANTSLPLETRVGCLTGGLGHTPAVTWVLTGRVEQVHNWATARQLKADHPAYDGLAVDFL